VYMSDHIKMNVAEVGCEGFNGVYQAVCCKRGNELSGSVKCREFCDNRISSAPLEGHCSV
jgi:hypothetical protein